MSLETIVDIVAVSTNPVKYNVECLICDDFISSETEDGDSLEPIAAEHLLTHSNQARPKLAPLSDSGVFVGVASSHLKVVPAVLLDNDSGLPPPRLRLRQAVACAVEPVVPELNDNGASTSGP